MKKYILSLLLLFPFFSCDKEESPEIYYKNRLCCEIVDKDGNDLLDPETGRFKVEDIRIYYLIDGKEKLLCVSNSDAPYGVEFFDIAEYVGYNSVGIRIARDIQLEEGNNRCTTIVKWDKEKTVVDTFICEGPRSKWNSLDIEKVYNPQGELLFAKPSSYRQGTPFVRLVK